MAGNSNRRLAGTEAHGGLRLMHRRTNSYEAEGDVELGSVRHRLMLSTTPVEDEEQRECLLGRAGVEAHDHGHDQNGNDTAVPAKAAPSIAVGVARDVDRPGAPRGQTSFNVKGPLAAWLDSLSPRMKFGILVSCVLLFFMLHNVLQEAMFKMEGFDFGWSLGMLEALGVLGGSILERAHMREPSKRVAPFHNYFVLAGLLGMSSSLSNMALHYIKYPTKVIFRSCKLIPTMAIAVLWRKKLVSRWEFLAASVVCAGLIIFAQADAKLEKDFNPIGIAMVMLSVCADAFLPNMQERVFGMGASRVEVTFYTNSLTVLGMVLSTSANGSLLEFLRYAISSQSAMLLMATYAILSHLAIAAHMMVLKEYGGVTAVLVGSTRKAMTISLSFFIFPKPFSYHFVLGGALVLCGLAANVMIKERRKGAEAARKSCTNLSTLDGGGSNGPTSSSFGNQTSAASTTTASSASTTASSGSGSGSSSGSACSRSALDAALSTAAANDGGGGRGAIASGPGKTGGGSRHRRVDVERETCNGDYKGGADGVCKGKGSRNGWNDRRLAGGSSEWGYSGTEKNLALGSARFSAAASVP